MMNPEALALLEEWQSLVSELQRLKTPSEDDPTAGIVEREMLLRKALADTLFRAPVEGANDIDIACGFVLRLTYSVARKMDISEVTAARASLAEIGISLDDLVEWKPSLRVAVYKALPEKVRQAVDRYLTVTPQAPRLEVVERKKG